MKDDTIIFDDDEIEAASHWYNGQGSMLYAITSTGALSRGTQRPWSHVRGEPMTDEEWMTSLAERLGWEAEEAARDASKQAKNAKGREKRELLTDANALLNIVDKAREAVETIDATDR
jgi:hypothetical protein